MIILPASNVAVAIKIGPLKLSHNKGNGGENYIYYMANPALGKSLCSDWFFLGKDFAVRTVSMETGQSVYFCFGARPANSKFATKSAKKKNVNIVILHIETTRRS